MYCNYCGAQQPDDSRFCNSCGAKLTAQVSAAQPEPVQQSAQQPNQAVAEQKKKKTPVWLVIVVALAAFLIGKYVISPSFVSNSGTNDNTGDQIQHTGSDNGGTNDDADNPAYEAIFTDTYIVHFQTFFNLDMSNYAMKRDDGIILCSDYGYKDDVVAQWVETVYMPIADYTDVEKAELDSEMKAAFQEIDALNCCSVTYKMGTNYYTITCTYTDVDQQSNYTELYNAGVLQTNTYISMSATETTLFSQGFVKK